jgi:hypothetical protein
MSKGDCFETYDGVDTAFGALKPKIQNMSLLRREDASATWIYKHLTPIGVKAGNLLSRIPTIHHQVCSGDERCFV